MRLYHLTTNYVKFLMTEGIGVHCKQCANLNPDSRPAALMYEWKFQKLFKEEPRAKWYFNTPRIHCMEDAEVWLKSGELGRLIDYIVTRPAPMTLRPAYLSFETTPRDDVWVAEGDWLRRFHTGEINTFDAHFQFAASRVSLEDYRRDYALPEFLVGNSISGNRLRWLNVPPNFRRATLNTVRTEKDNLAPIDF
jgi:hypothetical protein